jgi:hypothetical protein
LPPEFDDGTAVSGPDAGTRHPPTVLAPPVPEPRAAGRGLWWKVVAGAAAVGVGVGYGVLRLAGEDGSHGARTTTASASPSTASPSTDGPAPSDTASASTSASATESALPAGYRLVTDPAGFSLAVPDGWKRSERTAGVFYTTDDDRNLLQVFVVTESDYTPYEAVRTSSENLRRQPGYEEVDLEETGVPDGASPAVGEDAARLVYAYDSEKLGERKQGIEYAFTADDGTKYAVVVAGPAADWPAQQDRIDTALAHFATG